ncbi:MAG TPA: sialate O-acetylesterase [Candidatus Limnocylindria bacterium]|nr:sialate O-acetylesterase [Candidatus Limnocylindria bacterium]
MVGHSVAQGGDLNLDGATDDRVSTIAWPADSGATLHDYERTADPKFLPLPVGAHFSDGVIPVPFGHGPYFWAQFAERMVQSQDVPVLLLNAAFGGTSLEHWAKSARGESFGHSFVKSELRMPYINLHHALRRYARVTGVRAILADQGQNDWPEKDGEKVFANYVAWVDQARTDLGFPELAVVVNRATPPDTRRTIREVQERVIREVPYCFPGPDYDTLAPADRYDGVHLSAPGLTNAARLWAQALPAGFFQKVKPYQPDFRR